MEGHINNPIHITPEQITETKRHKLYKPTTDSYKDKKAIIKQIIKRLKESGSESLANTHKTAEKPDDTLKINDTSYTNSPSVSTGFPGIIDHLKSDNV